MTHALNTGGDRGYLRIATEEAFATREQIDAYLRMVGDGTADKGMTSLWGFYARSPSERAMLIIERLLDTVTIAAFADDRSDYDARLNALMRYLGATPARVT